MYTYVYTQWNTTQLLKNNNNNNENLPFPTTWMGLESTVLSERSQTEKDKYCTMSVLCGIPKMQ